MVHCGCNISLIQIVTIPTALAETTFVNGECNTDGEGHSMTMIWDPVICPVPIALVEVHFFEPEGECETPLNSPFLPPVALDVPIPLFDACFLHNGGDYNIHSCQPDG